MKQKIKYLIWGCSTAIIALTAIQTYFIYNTYILKEKDAETLVRAELTRMESEINIDSIRNDWFTKAEILVRTKGAEAAATFLSRGSPAISRQVGAYIKKNKILEKYHTTYEVIIRKVSLHGDGYALNLNNKRWFANGVINGGHQLILHDLITNIDAGGGLVRDFNSRSSFTIHDGSNSILREMFGLLIFSVVLLTVVILLFYFSIRSLITQKKIADMQTDFINNITHEFNTPLATMGIALSTVRSQLLLMEENSISSNGLNVIDRQYHRLKKLINQVVTHTGVTEQLVLQKVEIPLMDFLGNLLDDFQSAHSGIDLIRKLKDEPEEILTDPFYLTTAMTNLLENAVKYGGTQIIFDVVKQENSCLFMITDNGIGIAQADIGHIFQKFYRVEKGDIHTTKGLGLGLYYTRRIAAAHGGEVTVQSIPGKGSTFTMTIPIA
ncbi:HAMP domain-containing sensor histidine kinase [Pedobacter antarcticus]|uniref:sensor histidine kinase n=1 Tax=Pedobacter antarcticus TaxID=34086 RepID=UPI00293010A3|nr:HAMP domain-containing sensor histidine kinase [Pedobacter antarcticus]